MDRSDKQTAVRIKVEWVWCVETVWDCGKTWFCFLLSTIEEFIWRVHCNTCTAVQRMFVLPCAAASSLSDLACSNHRFYNKTWGKNLKCANVKEPFKYSVHVVTYGRCPVIIAWNVRFENGFRTGGDYVAVMWLPTGTKPDSSAACATTYPALLIHPWPRSRILLRAARTGTWRDGEEKAEQTDRWAETVWQTAAHGREQVLNSPTVKSLQCCIIIILPKCCKDGRCALLLHEA